MYVLTRRVLARQPEIAIDARRYVALSEATKIQRAALEIEEKFDLVVANYEELEREILTLTLTHAVRGDSALASMSSARLLLARRLVNLLTTCRLYYDQVMHSVSRSPAQLGCTREQANEVFSDQYDGNLAYRIMEALRNHIQHRTLAIAEMRYGCRREREEATHSLVEFTSSLTLDLEALRADGTFKKSTLEELEAVPRERQDLILFVRQYVESLGRAQERLRELLAPAVERADADVHSALTEWETVSDANTGLVALKRHDGSNSHEYVAVTGNLRERSWSPRIAHWRIWRVVSSVALDLVMLTLSWIKDSLLATHATQSNALGSWNTLPTMPTAVVGKMRRAPPQPVRVRRLGGRCPRSTVGASAGRGGSCAPDRIRSRGIDARDRRCRERIRATAVGLSEPLDPI